MTAPPSTPTTWSRRSRPSGTRRTRTTSATPARSTTSRPSGVGSSTRRHPDPAQLNRTEGASRSAAPLHLPSPRPRPPRTHLCRGMSGDLHPPARPPDDPGPVRDPRPRLLPEPDPARQPVLRPARRARHTRPVRGLRPRPGLRPADPRRSSSTTSARPAPGRPRVVDQELDSRSRRSSSSACR